MTSEDNLFGIVTAFAVILFITMPGTIYNIRTGEISLDKKSNSFLNMVKKNFMFAWKHSERPTYSIKLFRNLFYAIVISFIFGVIINAYMKKREEDKKKKWDS